MKILGYVLVGFLLNVAYAADLYDIKCVMPKMTTENVFGLTGTIQLNDDGSWHAYSLIAVMTKLRGKDSSLNLDSIIPFGKYTIFNEGQLAQKKVYALNFVSKNENFIRGYLNLEHPQALSSKITNVDGYTFKSKCELKSL